MVKYLRILYNPLYGNIHGLHARDSVCNGYLLNYPDIQNTKKGFDLYKLTK